MYLKMHFRLFKFIWISKNYFCKKICWLLPGRCPNMDWRKRLHVFWLVYHNSDIFAVVLVRLSRELREIVLMW